MNQVIIFVALLLVASVFMGIIILGRVAVRVSQERNGWIEAFMYLQDNPGDLVGAYRAASRVYRQTFIEAAAALMEKRKRDGA